MENIGEDKTPEDKLCSMDELKSRLHTVSLAAQQTLFRDIAKRALELNLNAVTCNKQYAEMIKCTPDEPMTKSEL